MLDGIRLSGAKLMRFKHNDPADLQELLDRQVGKTQRKLILVESVYSMDGDLAPLREIAQLAADHEAMLMVDEAHAVGMYGPNGEGRVRELGLTSSVTLSMGTLSKALAGYGGYVCCSEQMRSYLVQHSRSFIYTTAPPPAQVGAALGALDVLEQTPNMGSTLLERASRFRAALHGNGLNTLRSESQIIPVVVGENEKVMRIAQCLREQDILVGAIRPPTVPEGTARLRISLSLAHSDADIDRAIELITQAVHA